MALSTNIRLILSSTLTSAHNTLVTSQAPLTWSYTENFDSASHSPYKMFAKSAAITGGAVTYDLAGSLVDPLGDTVVFSTIYAVMLENGGANKMYLGGGSNGVALTSAAGSAQIHVPALGTYVGVFPTGITVGAGSSDNLKIAGTNGQTFEVFVIGK